MIVRLWRWEPLGTWRGGHAVFDNRREPLSRVYRRLGESISDLDSRDSRDGEAQAREAVVVEVVVVVVVVVDVVVAVGDRDLWLVPRSLADLVNDDDDDDDCVAANVALCLVGPHREQRFPNVPCLDDHHHREVFRAPQLPPHSCMVTDSALFSCACNKKKKYLH